MKHAYFLEHHVPPAEQTYLKAYGVGVTTVAIAIDIGRTSRRDEFEERVRIAVPGHDPIEFSREQEAQDAGTVIFVCSANDLDAESLWTLLCVGVG